MLDTVDDATARARGNSSAGWKQATPLQRQLVDAITGVDAHVIVTLRTRLEYVLAEYSDADGYRRYRPERIGMAPVQRPGIEYEFQLLGDLDLQHRLTISKSRCEVLADTIIEPDRATDAAQVFLEWLNDGEPPPQPADRDEVQCFLSCVKNAPAMVRHEMNAWWTARGLHLEDLTSAELDEAHARFVDLTADTELDAETDDLPRGSNDNGDARGAEHLDRGHDPPTLQSSDASGCAAPGTAAPLPTCCVCGTATGQLTTHQDGTVSHANTTICAARAQLRAVAADAGTRRGESG